ncbi:hypothetical protein EDB89DRAFT_1914549 [Lactarius sanguifluus]|nr:hypothetical protein EDB89DRAFT_1914549 [Lactarius sanguifluus]
MTKLGHSIGHALHKSLINNRFNPATPLPPTTTISSEMSDKYNDFDHYMNTGGHLDDARAAFNAPSTPSSSPPRRPTSDSDGMAIVRDILSELIDDHGHEGKDLLPSTGWASTPWSSLELLLAISAPLLLLPPPLSQDPDLHQAISDTVCGVVSDQFRFGLEPLETLSEEVRGGFGAVTDRFLSVEKKINFLSKLFLSSTVEAKRQMHPPSPALVAALAQDVEMAPMLPDPPAPVVAPVVAPVAPPPAPAPVAPVPAPPAPPPVSKPRAKKPSAPLPTPVPAKAQPASAKAKPPPVPSPAPVTRPTPLPASKPSFASMAKTPARPSLVVSLRPPVAGATIPQAVRRSPQEIVGHLNAVLSSEGHQVTLSAARWTVKNNLVVTAGPDTTAHHLASSSHLISDCLATYLSADQSPLPVQARENCKWARLTINGIPTGVSLTRGPYSPSELNAALLADNPVCRGLRMTLPPSWVRAPASYTPGSTSSIVLTFEDPSGDSLRSLMAERTLFAFGHAGELKRWKAKPRNTGKGAPAASS